MSIAIFLFLMLFLALGMPVSFALAIVGFLALLIISGPQGFVGLPMIFYDSLDSFTLTAIPLYIFMASILNQSKASDQLYEMVKDWVGHFSGGLAITTALLCTGFAAISGSSVAAAATIGSLSLPKMMGAGYDRRFCFGIVAAGGNSHPPEPFLYIVWSHDGCVRWKTVYCGHSSRLYRFSPFYSLYHCSFQAQELREK